MENTLHAVITQLSTGNISQVTEHYDVGIFRLATGYPRKGPFQKQLDRFNFKIEPSNLWPQPKAGEATVPLFPPYTCLPFLDICVTLLGLIQHNKHVHIRCTFHTFYARRQAWEFKKMTCTSLVITGLKQSTVS